MVNEQPTTPSPGVVSQPVAGTATSQYQQQATQPQVAPAAPVAPTGAPQPEMSPAMDFLFTYGWAILVVLIAISALWYFGVFNPQSCGGMPLRDAMTIAHSNDSTCSQGATTGEATCNAATKTYWLDLDMQTENKEGCKPACAIDTATKASMIQLRCPTTPVVRPNPNPVEVIK